MAFAPFSLSAFRSLAERLPVRLHEATRVTLVARRPEGHVPLAPGSRWSAVGRELCFECGSTVAKRVEDDLRAYARMADTLAWDLASRSDLIAALEAAAVGPELLLRLGSTESSEILQFERDALAAMARGQVAFDVVVAADIERSADLGRALGAEIAAQCRYSRLLVCLTESALAPYLLLPEEVERSATLSIGSDDPDTLAASLWCMAPDHSELDTAATASWIRRGHHIFKIFDSNELPSKLGSPRDVDVLLLSTQAWDVAAAALGVLCERSSVCGVGFAMGSNAASGDQPLVPKSIWSASDGDTLPDRVCDVVRRVAPRTITNAFELETFEDEVFDVVRQIRRCIARGRIDAAIPKVWAIHGSERNGRTPRTARTISAGIRTVLGVLLSMTDEGSKSSKSMRFRA